MNELITCELITLEQKTMLVELFDEWERTPIRTDEDLTALGELFSENE